jgi:hypothetical protein
VKKHEKKEAGRSLPNCWVFQLRKSDDTSAISSGRTYPWQTHSGVRSGDYVILWKPGDEAGAFGFGKVLATTIKKAFFGKPVSLRFKVTDRFDHTLSKVNLAKDPVMRTLQVVQGKGFGAGILAASQAHFQRLQRLRKTVKSTSYWIFQSNPRTGDDLRNILAENPWTGWWRITRFKDPRERILPGDKIALWQVEGDHPEASGIYAIGEITKTPIRVGGKWRGWYQLTTVRDLDNPIPPRLLRADRVLEKIPAFGRRAAQGSNFRINQGQWERIVSYFPDRNRAEPNGRNGKTRVTIKSIAFSNSGVETAFVPDIPAHEIELRERRLVTDYRHYMRQKGLKLQPYAIELPGGDFIACDLYDRRHRLLIEAKSIVSRPSVRMAIGQIADYSRFFKAQTLAVLLINRPGPDLEKLLRSQKINSIWQTEDGGFLSNATNGRLA